MVAAQLGGAFEWRAATMFVNGGRARNRNCRVSTGVLTEKYERTLAYDFVHELAGAGEDACGLLRAMAGKNVSILH
jgi:hypothetical protein